MANLHHNWLTIKAPQEERVAFIADALRASQKHHWDWVRIVINDSHFDHDTGESLLDFYTNGHPYGLDDLMSLHPDILIQAAIADLNHDVYYKKRRGNVVLWERTEPIIWDDEWKRAEGGA